MQTKSEMLGGLTNLLANKGNDCMCQTRKGDLLALPRQTLIGILLGH